MTPLDNSPLIQRNSPKTTMSSTLSFYLACVALVLSLGIAPKPGYSQANPTDAQLSKQFQDDFMKGCLQGKTPGLKNQATYCNCMVKSYQTRYDGRALAAITQLSGTAGEQGPALVGLMMSPEARICTAKS
jgi:hypothetical protein